MPSDPSSAMIDSAAGAARASRRNARPSARRSVAYRIALACVSAFALANLVLGAGVLIAAHRAIGGYVEHELSAETDALVAVYRAGGRARLVAAIARREAGNTANDLLYALYDRHGRRIAGAMIAQPPQHGQSRIRVRDMLRGARSARLRTIDLADGSRLAIAADEHQVEGLDRTIAMLFGGALLAIVLIGTLTALIIARYMTRRLSAMAQTAEAIRAGRLDARVTLGRYDDEFDQLGAALNAMLARISDLMVNLRHVSNDVAHDLRTPLTRLRQMVERSLAGPDDPVAQRQVLERVEAGIDEVLRLFGAILRITSLESESPADLRAIDLSAIVEDLCDSYAPALEDGGRALLWRVDPAVVLKGDGQLLAQLLVNLLDNAQAHTPVGCAIAVSLSRGEGVAELAVADDGPGVAPERRKAIFERFVREESSRTTPGNGLGLSLVRAIAQYHSGQVEAFDNAPGLCVRVRLPLQGARE
ncbi:HAMP domain-containing histidine kinase [Novosphingobium sp. 1949]|uniref:histidine kinase n=1 Tax=Novosphingobium organovorum TaxID=2930092 RepID=A0ABT0BFZ7_9SPHN|nr:HAMP domain-containing sensor histidine kinase [Novosphingobium organovorum]MCJ2183958.1 HAMP domain-containing histidine kinase [Novosphingobium organovorum]